jgi:hypothetical protein
MDDLLTRRRLIQIGGTATAAVYLARFAPPAAAASGGVPGFLVRSSYLPLVGAPFAVAGGSGPLILNAVSDLVRAQAEPALAGSDDAFTLSFAGSPDAVLGSGIHELSQPALGAFSVFIAPVDRAAGTQAYEVVVDRSLPGAVAARRAPAPLALPAAASPAALATAPVAPTPAAAAPARATPGAARTKPAASPRPADSATVARRGGILTADLRVAGVTPVVSVRASLTRGPVEYARAGRLLRGHLALRLPLRELRPVTPGTYELRLTWTEGSGRRVVTHRRVTLR